LHPRNLRCQADHVIGALVSDRVDGDLDVVERQTIWTTYRGERILARHVAKHVDIEEDGVHADEGDRVGACVEHKGRRLSLVRLAVDDVRTWVFSRIDRDRVDTGKLERVNLSRHVHVDAGRHRVTVDIDVEVVVPDA